MGKKYPPIIEGTLPAFYPEYTVDENGVGIENISISIPFSMNKSVNWDDISAMSLKVKTISNSVYIDTATTTNFTKTKVIFELSNKDVYDRGQHYKIQIAYVDNDDIVGYYSTVGVAKYTERPVVEIQGLSLDKANPHVYEYVGSYENIDGSESVYSYQFNLYDKNYNVIAASGEQIHNSSNNVTNETGKVSSTDSYKFNKDLIQGEVYYIDYKVTTLNNLEISTPKYKIVQEEMVAPEIEASIIASMNVENGYVDLRLAGLKDSSGLEKTAVGQFKIYRTSEESDYLEWDEIYEFSLLNQNPSIINYKDFTVKQGINYKYALQQFNRFNIVSNKSISTDIFVDFEHAFLSDGERQLKIKYNPKVTSFKEIMLETKTNTIGSKYPYIFRNGNVRYKEFPISGLISCWSDDAFLFVDEKTFEKFDYSANLTGENIYTEREFKLQVLEWLNNGKPKLFRSPTEGNYIIRLLNVSFSPTDGVGRMLHTFSGTASEIAECNYNNLRDMGLVKSVEQPPKSLYWRTVDLAAAIILQDINATSLLIEGATSYQKFALTINNEELVIVTDASGNYELTLNEGIEISSIEYLDEPTQGLLTYSYWSEPRSRFSLISNIDIVDSGLLVFNGPNDNILELYNDVKRKVKTIYYCRLTKSAENTDLTIINNNVSIDINDSDIYEVSNLTGIDTIALGEGVTAELLIQYYEYTYEFESSEDLNTYNNIYQTIQDAIYDDAEMPEGAYEEAENAYREYVSLIENKLQEELSNNDV